MSGQPDKRERRAPEPAPIRRLLGLASGKPESELLQAPRGRPVARATLKES